MCNERKLKLECSSKRNEKGKERDVCVARRERDRNMSSFLVSILYYLSFKVLCQLIFKIKNNEKPGRCKIIFIGVSDNKMLAFIRIACIQWAKIQSTFFL